MFALLFSVLLAQPYVSMGVCDDWSYIWSARVLADTGHLTYNGWGAMPLGWLAYLGALFIKLFGFSFTIVRSSGMVVSMLCAALMQRIFVRTGTTEGMATVATLTLVLSPLFLPLSFSFMSDIPALFALVLCIYCCLRAIQAISDRGALGWLACAAFSNIIGGTVRQTAWLGVLLLMPSAAWYMRRRRYVLPVGAALWGIGVLCIALFMHWFRVQPYAVVDKVFYRYHINSVFFAANTAATSLLCLVPIMCAFIAACAPGKRLMRNVAAITGAITGSLLFWWAMTSPHDYFRTAPFATDGSYVTLTGMGVGTILGFPPKVVPFVVQLLLAVLMFSALFCLIVCSIGERETLLTADSRTAPNQGRYPYVSNKSLVVLFVPFVLAYLFLIVTRSTVYDRYFLPLQFVFTLGIVRVYRQAISERLPRLCLAVGLVFAAYGIATMHDVFAFYRARLDAANEIIETGIPQTAIEGGFEYDAWTQLQQDGYANDPRILSPPDAYHKWTPPAEVPTLCVGWTRKFFPSLHPMWHLSFAPNNCFEPSAFAPVVYSTWLPPRQRTIYILENR